MSFGIVGHVRDYSRQANVDWVIKGFFTGLKAVDGFYESPPFNFSSSTWQLKLYPNGETKHISEGFIGIYVMRRDPGPSKTVDFTFCIKGADGRTEKTSNNVRIFDRRGCGWGCHQFVERAELFRRRTELAPSGTLTITCTMKADDQKSMEDLKVLTNDLKDMLLSKERCDMTIQVKNQSFLAHKCILSARSSVFASMLEREMSEKTLVVINIEDCDPETFGEFLVYLYTGEVENPTLYNVCKLYPLADKYCVQGLKSFCVLFVKQELSVENVCDIAALGDQYGVPKLMSTVQYFFNENFREIVGTPNWEALLKEHCHIANELLKGMTQCNSLQNS